MRPALVVASQPVGSHAAHLGQRLKDVAVQDLLAVSSIEAFDVAVLHRFAGLDEQQCDFVSGSPFGESVADQFWAVIHAQPPRCTSQLDQLLERFDDASPRQAGIDLDPQRLSVIVIEQVERAEASGRPQCIRHDVDRPDLVGSCGNQKRGFDARRQPSLALAFQVHSRSLEDPV